MFIWQKDLFSVACYICACMKLHTTLLEEQDPNTQLGWNGVISIYLSYCTSLHRGHMSRGARLSQFFGLQALSFLYAYY